MSDEKRQTRLLPFRLRRAARTDASVNGERDFAADAELTALLRTWDAPSQEAGARGRLLADFRASVRPAPLWRRALTAQVRVPLPVAACTAVVILGALYAIGTRATTSVGTGLSQTVTEPAAVRVVEVPVVQERVVTRTVYVEKKVREGARAAVPRRPEREELAQQNAQHERGAATSPNSPNHEPAQGQEAQAFTRVDMNDFQPASEMKFRIVSRGAVNEK